MTEDSTKSAPLPIEMEDDVAKSIPDLDYVCNTFLQSDQFLDVRSNVKILYDVVHLLYSDIFSAGISNGKEIEEHEKKHKERVSCTNGELTEHSLHKLCFFLSQSNDICENLVCIVASLENPHLVYLMKLLMIEI